MYLYTGDKLDELGFHQYEISNFARLGFASRHNLKYWTGGEYLGFGPSAASDFAGKRFTIARDLAAYCDGILTGGAILSECEEIPSRERAGEYLMLRLRRVQGLSLIHIFRAGKSGSGPEKRDVCQRILQRTMHGKYRLRQWADRRHRRLCRGAGVGPHW